TDEYPDDWDIVEEKECHGVLRCDHANCNARYWGRDVNAAINMVELLKNEVLGLTSVPRKLISLEWLNIEKTLVEEMPGSMLSLQYLNCNDTKASTINTDGYVSLRKLACRGCSIDPFSFDNGLDVMM
ncbi:hypothetical protein JG688_00009114, partial [Phytophthora aleatoria]